MWQFSAHPRQASIAHFQKALSINPTFTKASQLGNPTNIVGGPWSGFNATWTSILDDFCGFPIFIEAMNNMACAAGLGAITGILPREYYQHAINALDQVLPQSTVKTVASSNQSDRPECPGRPT